MEMEKFIRIVQKNTIGRIYSTGVVLAPDNGENLAEYVPNRSFLFFEFGMHLIKFEAIEQYSKILITEVPSLTAKVEVEDAIPVKSVVTDLILENSLIDNRIKQIEFFNIEENNNGVVCDSLRLSLISNTNNQELFLDPQFFGINIGGAGVERIWRVTQLQGYSSISTIVNFQ